MPYLKTILEPLLIHPDSLTIEETFDERGVLLSVGVHADDMGKIIGRQGVNISAIRSLMHLWGMDNKQHISVKLLEPEGRYTRRDLDDALTNSRTISA